MGVQVFPAEAAGELNGADENGRDSGEGVGDEVETVGNHAGMLGIRQVEDGQIVEEEDCKAHEGKDAPEDELRVVGRRRGPEWSSGHVALLIFMVGEEYPGMVGCREESGEGQYKYKSPAVAGLFVLHTAL